MGDSIFPSSSLYLKSKARKEANVSVSGFICFGFLRQRLSSAFASQGLSVSQQYIAVKLLKTKVNTWLLKNRVWGL